MSTMSIASLLALTLAACGPSEKQAASKQEDVAKETATPAERAPAARDASATDALADMDSATAIEASARREDTESEAMESEDAFEGDALQEEKATPPAKSESAPAAAQTPAASDDPAITATREFITSKAIDKTTPTWKTKLPKPTKLTFEPERKYFWLLNTTEGPIKIRLMPDVAPMHVSSTIYLTELGFYDGLKFHRVIPGFMAQGGDPLGMGTGGPGYKYDGEFSPKARHSKPGMLSMAHAGPGTDGSQFFLTFKETAFLDDKHTVFGEVVEGLENLMKMEKAGSAGGQTSKPVVIESAKIVTK
jgi:peptidyl-prolyl cis-trans isomerase B (cyclophilin B)